VWAKVWAANGSLQGGVSGEERGAGFPELASTHAGGWRDRCWQRRSQVGFEVEVAGGELGRVSGDQGVLGGAGDGAKGDPVDPGG